MKKILLSITVLLMIAVGVLFAMNGSRHYDPSKYHLKVAPANKPFGVGSTITFRLPDQFNTPQSLPADTRKLIFVFTKATGHIFRSWMAAHEQANYLNKHKLAAVADVSGMPTIILNTFAMPDFRKSQYSLELIYDKAMAAKLKKGQQVDKVIVMTLRHGKVTKVEHAGSVKALDALLK